MSVSKVIKSIKTSPSSWVKVCSDEVGVLFTHAQDNNWKFIYYTPNFSGGCALINKAEGVAMRWDKGDAIGEQLISYLKSSSSTQSNARQTNVTQRTVCQPNVAIAVAKYTSAFSAQQVVNTISSNPTFWIREQNALEGLILAFSKDTNWKFINVSLHLGGGYALYNEKTGERYEWDRYNQVGLSLWESLKYSYIRN